MSVIAASKCKLAGQVKRTRLLTAIRESSLISRQELCRVTGLSKPVVSRLTRQLLDEDLIEEVGRGSSSKSGRPVVLLSMNRSASLFAGIDVTDYATWAVLTNVNAESLAEFCVPTPRWDDKDAFVGFIANMVNRLRQEANVESGALRGLSLLICGHVSRNGTVELIYHDSNVPSFDIAREVERAVEVETKVSSGYWHWAAAEKQAAEQTQDEPFDALLVACNRSIAIMPTYLEDPMAPAVNGRMNFGHISYQRDGLPCRCGSRGCLEAYAAGWAIERDARAHPSDLMLARTDGDPSQITVRTVLDAAARGDLFSLTLVREAGNRLGEMLAPLIQYHAAETIFFAGELFNRSSIYFDAICSGIRSRIPDAYYDRLSLRVSSISAYAPPEHAINCMVDESLQAPLRNVLAGSSG